MKLKSPIKTREEYKALLNKVCDPVTPGFFGCPVPKRLAKKCHAVPYGNWLLAYDPAMFERLFQERMAEDKENPELALIR